MFVLLFVAQEAEAMWTVKRGDLLPIYNTMQKLQTEVREGKMFWFCWVTMIVDYSTKEKWRSAG